VARCIVTPEWLALVDALLESGQLLALVVVLALLLGAALRDDSPPDA
jgi:hypothetical protein